jgi:hypothetical protein
MWENILHILEANDMETCDLEEDSAIDDDRPASKSTQGNDTAWDIDENEGLNDLSLSLCTGDYIRHLREY